ncbi:MAG TPA: chloride channel protein [Acetobacteraceae bacterium]|nr:chloride channel protein [Acetobacteraceae bacterium]
MSSFNGQSLQGTPLHPRAPSLDRPRRPISEWVLHAPQTLRALVRADELWLVILAAMVGVAAGLLVVAMNTITLLMHDGLFDLPAGERLSGQTYLDPIRCVAVPALGGLLLGLFGLLLARMGQKRAIDPIEANALYGGQMSLRDSMAVVAQTLLSNGAGASIGLEAGYTQIGSAVASRLGRMFRVRRSDLRLLVGCGAAGAIAAAFNAPLTGAFYAFELVIGTYSLLSLAPVVVAAICAMLVMRLLTEMDTGFAFALALPASIETADYLPILALGMVAAGVGIALMRGVTLTEDLFRRSRVPVWLRPAIGGLTVGLLGLVSPAVLSSGHAALRIGLAVPWPLPRALLLLLLKAMASAISIGSGFRGGLFFASLFLGSLVGESFAGLMALAGAGTAQPTVVYALVGMSALAVAVVGGPLTMAFLALESTGSLPLTVAVLVASVVCSLTVRRTFGYSFATWRFHLRGEAIRSAVDIGWMRNLTVGRMMRRELRTIRTDTSLAAFRREFPLGATQRVIVVDDRDNYAGIVLVSEAHAAGEEITRLSELLHHTRTVLLPQMTVKEAVAMFETAEADALAVVESAERMRVIGLLTEQYTLRRYSEELERRRRELSGGE